MSMSTVKIDYDQIAGELPAPWCTICKKRVDRMKVERMGVDSWRSMFWCHGQSGEVKFRRSVLKLWLTQPQRFYNAVAFRDH